MADMAKSLVLHVGDPKTGSSSIQKVLFERRWNCESCSLDYPEVLSSMELANCLREDAGPGEAEEVFSRYAFWLEHSLADVAVISAEQFTGVNPEKVRNAIDKYFTGVRGSVRVIAYARPHTARFISAYAQRIKAGQINISMSEFYKRRGGDWVLNMHRRFSGWRAVFGKDFIVRPMVRSELHGGDVVSDFLDIVLSGSDFSIEGSTRENVSIPAEALSGIRLVQEVLAESKIEHPHCQAIGDYLNTLVSRNPKLRGAKLSLGRALYNRLKADYMADAEAMDQDFFGRPIMVQALLDAERDIDAERVSMNPKQNFRPRAIEKIRVIAKRLAEELQLPGHFWIKAKKRDKGRKPFFLGNVEMDSRAPADIARVEKTLVELSEILVSGYGKNRN